MLQVKSDKEYMLSPFEAYENKFTAGKKNQSGSFRVAVSQAKEEIATNGMFQRSAPSAPSGSSPNETAESSLELAAENNAADSTDTHGAAHGNGGEAALAANSSKRAHEEMSTDDPS